MLEQVMKGLEGRSTVRDESPIKIEELAELPLGCGEGKISDGLDSLCQWLDSSSINVVA